MTKWSISPAEGTTIDENGNATFPENTSTQDITYTITYNGSECGEPLETHVTIKGCAADCTKYAFVNKNANVPYTNNTALVATSSSAEEPLRCTSKPDEWVTAVQSFDGEDTYITYLATIQKNTDTQERSGEIIFTANDGCQFTATISQEAATVNCEKYEFETESVTVDALSTEVEIASSKYDSSLPTLNVTNKPNWVTAITTSISNSRIIYKASYSINDADYQRNGTITFTTSDGCTFTSGMLAQEEKTWVDMGTGVGLWGKYNVGATKPSEYGKYYQYGTGRNNTTGPITEPHVKYWGTENPLDRSLDSATQVLGPKWHTPTLEELQTLMRYSTTSRTTYDGVLGTEFKSNVNGNKIFFPYAGMYTVEGYIDEGHSGTILSSTPHDSGYCYCLRMTNVGNAETDDIGRDRALPVRGIIVLN